MLILYIPLLVLPLIYYILDKLHRRLSTLQTYYIHAKAHACHPATPLPKPLFAKLRHKLSLLAYSGTDVFDDFFAQKYIDYGPTHVLHDSLGVPSVIHTCDPSNVSTILSSRFDDYRMSRRRADALRPVAQGGLGNTEGAIWHRHRKMIMRHMSNKRVRDVGQNEGDLRALVRAIEDGGVDGSGWTREVDLLVLFHRMTLDMATTFLLGTGAGSQLKALEEEESNLLVDKVAEEGEMTWAEAYDVARTHFSWRSKLGSWYWIVDGPKYRKACKILNRYADTLIATAINHASTHPIDDARYGLTGTLVREMPDAHAIRELIMDIFVAGKDMTANAISWLFARLEHHPDIFAKVRKEVLETFGTEEEPTVAMTWDSLQSCRALQNLILETLRFYPLLPNLGRTARVDTVLPRGGGADGTQPIAVPKGASVSCNIYMMHRLTEKWGDDTREFNPDRWNDRKVGSEFAAFGAGPRICIGMSLSLGEISYVTARLLQRFKAIKAPEGQDNLEKAFKVLFSPANGVKVRLQRA